MPKGLPSNTNPSREINEAMVRHFQSLIGQTITKIEDRRHLLDKNNASEEERAAMERHFSSLVNTTKTKIRSRLDIIAQKKTQ